MKKVLVTGGAGFIGSHLVESLCRYVPEVIVIDNLTTGYLKNLDDVIDKIEFIEESIEDFDLATIENLDAVVHLAAQTSVPLSVESFKASSTKNILGTINIIDYCKNNNISFVYASSSALYGELPLGDDESPSIDLISPYAVDKYSMELYSNVANKLYGLRSIGLRFFNVYGPRQDPSSPYSGVISIFVEKLLTDQMVTVNGGYQTRDFIYISDIVKGIEESLRYLQVNSTSDYINVLTGKSYTINELLEMLISITGKKPEVNIKDLPIGDPVESGGTVEKMKRLLHINPEETVDLLSGLKSTVEFIKNDQ